MNKMLIGESSFELWACEVFFKHPEVIAFWNQSSDPFTRAKALLIMKYAGGKIMSPVSVKIEIDSAQYLINLYRALALQPEEGLT